MGASPTPLPVISTARTSIVASSMARWTLRQTRNWYRLSAGNESKGPRWYDWAALTLPRYQQDPAWVHALLVRRSLSDPSVLTYYVVYAPVDTKIHEWVRVAGQRGQVQY